MVSKHLEAKQSRVSPKLLAGIILALFFGVALYLRVCLPYDQVFSGDWIKFTGIDAYYHMRIIDNLVHNFPSLAPFDPYFIYPGGSTVGSIRFFDWLLAGIIWVIGLGSPTQHTVDVVSVYFPAVLGALVVIPVYFIGKELFSRWAGVISAGLIALLPGEFLGRSILGFTDHHVAETLFATVTMLFLILAVKTARQKQLTFNHLKRRDWATSAKPAIHSLLAGIFLGIYLLTWAGALLFVFIISIYFIIQFIIDHLKRKSTDYLCLVGVILFFSALMIFLTVSPARVYLVSTLIALLIPLVLYAVSRLTTLKKIKPAYYPLALVGFGLAGLAIFYMVNPSLISSMLSKFSVFAPAGVALTTLEMQPLLFPRGEFSTHIAWGNFTTSFFLSLVSLGILTYLVIKQGGADKSLLIVWTLVVLAATLGQRRFAYYLAVNIALLTGYLSWQMLRLAGFKELATKPVEAPQERDYYEVLGIARTASHKQIKRAFRNLASRYHPDGKGTDSDEARFKQISKAYEVLRDPHKRAAYNRSMYGIVTREKTKPITARHATMALGVIVIFFFVFFPNIRPATDTASQVRFAPSDAWMSSLIWLKENSPDPFGDPDFYYEFHERSLSPKPAYGVIAWWDYGYWITRIAHRVPNANPSQGHVTTTNVACFFTSQDENSAQEIIQEMGPSYLIIDYETAIGKFWAIVTWAGREETEFYDVYYLPQEGNLVPVQFLYPEYYRSLSTRLYNFDGKAVTPESTVVVSYQEMADEKGNLYRVITGKEEFTSYEEAEAYLSSQKSANYRIVGTNPFITPVPLDGLKHYKLIHSSDELVMQPGVGMIPEVKIFEYD